MLANNGMYAVQELVDFLADKVSSLKDGQRYILGIAGYPGAGKSTAAEWLADGVNNTLSETPAKVVPLDGYHFANEKLQEMDLLLLKGIPDTFDALGFIDLLKRLRTITDTNVYCPLFDRSIEASIPDAIVIEPKHKLCVVEGNYLLLEKSPWNGCRQYFDEVWFLDVSFDTILPRLQARHERGGTVAPEAARKKMESTDLPNARLVDQTKNRAHRILNIVQPAVAPR